MVAPSILRARGGSSVTGVRPVAWAGILRVRGGSSPVNLVKDQLEQYSPRTRR